MIYLLVALLIILPILVGVVDHCVYRKAKANLIASHKEEIQKTRAEWHQYGWDGAIEFVKREAHYELIKKGLIKPTE